ncbi:MAG TPA: DUF2382 domain-containing protein [Nodularia sp. (in: cyanobacteria)]|nr:DUF2382 domain-containing protein [Nodularia sp. (in: cyanobacteria)]
MPLYKLEHFDPNYRETFGGDDVKALDLYTEGGVRIGSVADALVDHDGRFRYLVIDSTWDSISKKILLPIGLGHINYPAKRVYVDGLSKEQVEHLPEYQESMTVDENYEKQVRHVFRPQSRHEVDNHEISIYEREPNLYNLNEQYHQTLRLYEERLVANKHRVKTGEVSVGKHIEIQTARVTVPIKKERVLIERVPPTETGIVVDPNALKFQEGEVTRIELYEEMPEVRKEAFVREEVRVTKVIDRQTVEAQDTIRREQLDIDTTGELLMDETVKKREESV